jgi:hypothetical protein
MAWMVPVYWLLGFIAVVAVYLLTERLAEFVYRGGRKTLGRFIRFLQFPLGLAVSWSVAGAAWHHGDAAMAWSALRLIAGGVTGQCVWLVAKATVRTRRILRARRAGEVP